MNVSRCQRLVSCCLMLVIVNVTAQAQSWREVKEICPVDRTEVRARFWTGSRLVFEISPLMTEAKGHAASLVQCPNCGYCAHADRFAADLKNREELKQKLLEPKSSRLFFRNDAATVVEQHTRNDLMSLALLALANRSLAEETGDPVVIRKRSRKAIDALRAVAEDEQLSPDRRAMIAFETGRAMMLAGQSKDAVPWFDRALAAPSRLPGFFIQKDRWLALHEGRVTPEVVRAIARADAMPKLAAVALLRDSELPEAISLLEQVCLAGPETHRNFVFLFLVNRSPLSRHLPIFRKAIGSSEFRTVQAGARAVELIRDRESAPLLAAALENPVRNAEFRLLSALSELATENEIPLLTRMAEKSRHSSEVIRGLLNTKSAKALPAALGIIQRESLPAQRYLFRDDEGRRALQSATQIEGLHLHLPSLKSAEPDSKLAGFKVLLLGASQTPESRDELSAALERGEPLALSAAIELVRCRDERGKPLFLKRLKQIRRMDSVSWKLVLPILRPDDFAAIQKALDAERNDWQQSIEFRRESLAMAENEEERQRHRQRLNQMLNRENSWMAPWLQLLGATGHPEARPLMLKFLDDPNHRARAAAVQGSLRVYDRDLGDRLARLLETETEPDVLLGLMDVFGESKDVSRLPAVLLFGRGPMPVDVRIAWIRAVRSLNGLDAVQAKLNSLTDSPNPKLAAAVRKAITPDQD